MKGKNIKRLYRVLGVLLIIFAVLVQAPLFTVFAKSEEKSPESPTSGVSQISGNKPTGESSNIKESSGKDEAESSDAVKAADTRQDSQSPAIQMEQTVNTGESTGELQSVTRGDAVTYTITLTNPTQAALENVAVVDSVPQGLLINTESISNNGAYNKASGEITWVISSMQAEQTMALSFTANVPTGTAESSWTNQATMNWTGNTSGPLTSNSVAIATPVINISIEQQTSSNSNVDVARTTDNIVFKAGQIVTYFITVTNVGEVNATNLVVTDQLPVGLTYIRNSATGSPQIEDNKFTWNIALLEPGNTQTGALNFSCQLPDSTSQSITFRNFAYVTWKENGANSPVISNQLIIGSTAQAQSTPITGSTRPTTTTTTTRTVRTIPAAGSNVSTVSPAAPKTGVENTVIPVLLSLISVGLVVLVTMVIWQLRKSKL